MDGLDREAFGAEHAFNARGLFLVEDENEYASVLAGGGGVPGVVVGAEVGQEARAGGCMKKLVMQRGGMRDALFFATVVKDLQHLLDAAVCSQVVAADGDSYRIALEGARKPPDVLGPCCADCQACGQCVLVDIGWRQGLHMRVCRPSPCTV